MQCTIKYFFKAQFSKMIVHLFVRITQKLFFGKLRKFRTAGSHSHSTILFKWALVKLRKCRWYGLRMGCLTWDVVGHRIKCLMKFFFKYLISKIFHDLKMLVDQLWFTAHALLLWLNITLTLPFQKLVQACLWHWILIRLTS